MEASVCVKYELALSLFVRSKFQSGNAFVFYFCEVWSKDVDSARRFASPRCAGGSLSRTDIYIYIYIGFALIGEEHTSGEDL